MRIPGFTAEASLYQSGFTFIQTYTSSTEPEMVNPAGILGGILAAGSCAVCLAGDNLDGSNEASWGRVLACAACGVAIVEPL